MTAVFEAVAIAPGSVQNVTVRFAEWEIGSPAASRFGVRAASGDRHSRALEISSGFGSEKVSSS